MTAVTHPSSATTASSPMRSGWQHLCMALLVTAGVLCTGVASAQAQKPAQPVSSQAEERPDVLIKRITGEVMAQIKADTELQSGDSDKTIELVNQTILPHLNFEAMTRQAVGRNWSQATPEEKTALQQEFKQLLVRTYSGALSRAGDHAIKVRRLRAAEDDKSVEVKTLITGGSQPLKVNYRMEKEATGWKIHDVSVENAWLIEAWRGDFAQTAKDGGVQELLRRLRERNSKNAAKATPGQ